MRGPHEEGTRGRRGCVSGMPAWTGGGSEPRVLLGELGPFGKKILPPWSILLRNELSQVHQTLDDVDLAFHVGSWHQEGAATVGQPVDAHRVGVDELVQPGEQHGAVGMPRIDAPCGLTPDAACEGLRFAGQPLVDPLVGIAPVHLGLGRARLLSDLAVHAILVGPADPIPDLEQIAGLAPGGQQRRANAKGALRWRWRRHEDARGVPARSALGDLEAA